MSRSIFECIGDLFINFSAGWFGIIIISPIINTSDIMILKDLIYGIIFFFLAILAKNYESQVSI